MHTTFLQGLWFLLIGVLWGGYFVLEGFDFGVAMLVRPLGRDEVEKRMIIHTIGPVWDGNEVWLLTAGGATFAAFPVWYATAFSGFYLALFLVLVALIIRGVSFEFWGKVDSPRWRSTWEWAMGIASGAAALLFGVAWANFIYGVPMGPAHIVHATLFDLLHPYALLGGLVTLTLFLTHGANFLALRTTEDVRDRARATARRVAPVAAVLMIAFLVWTLANQSFGIGVLIPAIVAGLLVAARSDRPVALGRRGVHDRGRRGPGADGRLLRRALPERAAVEHQPRVRSDAGVRLLQSLHADGDDGRRDHVRAGCARLHGVDLLGVPAQARSLGLRRHADADRGVRSEVPAQERNAGAGTAASTGQHRCAGPQLTQTAPDPVARLASNA